MERFMEMQLKLFPDFISEMEKRYTILNVIDLLGPIGRRTIMEVSKLSERSVRKEIAFLEQHAFITVSSKGVKITPQGKTVLTTLAPYMNELTGISTLEKQLITLSGMDEIIIVKGDSESDPHVKEELGRSAANYLKTIITSDVTIAVTGGTTLASVANYIEPFGKHRCLFVPARGGTGEQVEIQANTIVAKMAEREKGDYRLLHVPDPLSESVYQTLIAEPAIQETLQLIHDAEIVLHGLGDALTIARRRKSSKQTMELLTKHVAVGEVFGYYFNERGEIVHQVRTIGIQLDQLDDRKTVITIAGGKPKARALKAFLQFGISNVLIIDEAAAEEMIKLYERSIS